MQISRNDIEKLMTAITDAETCLKTSRGLCIKPRLTTREECEAVALAMLSIRQVAQVSVSDTVQIHGGFGFGK